MPTPDIVKRFALSKRKYFIYNVKFVCGMQKNEFKGDECSAILSSGIYSTEVNILNFGGKEVSIVKVFIPVVVNNKAIAREPKTHGPVSAEKVVLKGLHATMDDCCKINEMLKELKADEHLKIGFIEIISPIELEVYGVYSVTDMGQQHPTVDVVQVQGKTLSIG